MGYNSNYNYNKTIRTEDGETTISSTTVTGSQGYQERQSMFDGQESDLRISMRRFSIGRIASRTALICGFIAIFFAIAPLMFKWLVCIFWLLYPFALLSIVASVVAFFNRRVWSPVFAIILSLGSVIVAWACSGIYVLAAASSVNSLTGLAKTFIDALKWPF